MTGKVMTIHDQAIIDELILAQLETKSSILDEMDFGPLEERILAHQGMVFNIEEPKDYELLQDGYTHRMRDDGYYHPISGLPRHRGPKRWRGPAYREVEQTPEEGKRYADKAEAKRQRKAAKRAAQLLP